MSQNLNPYAKPQPVRQQQSGYTVADINRMLQERCDALDLAQAAFESATDEYNRALEQYKTANHNLELAESKAYSRAEGTAGERKAMQVLAVRQQRIDADVAECYKVAAYGRKEVAEADLTNARSKLSAVQSLVKIVETEMQLTRNRY